MRETARQRGRKEWKERGERAWERGRGMEKRWERARGKTEEREGRGQGLRTKGDKT